MKVIEALKKKPKGKDLADRIGKEVRVRALNKLEHVRDLYPNFTDHSIRHGEGVITILDWLIPDDVKEQLNKWELYFLIAAAYLHDIGMVEGCPGTPEGREWEGFYNNYRDTVKKSGCSPDDSEILINAKREFVREKHHLRSQEYIRDKWIELGLRESDTQAEGNIVARLALGHRSVDLGDRTLFGEIPFGNELIRRDILAAYLRIADELDTSAHRTPWAEYEVIQRYDDISAVEWAKHLSISGVYPEGGIIVIAGECRDHQVYLRLNRLKDELSNKLAEIKRMIRRPYATGDGFFVDDPIPYNDIELRIEHVGYLPIDIKFELQDREIAKLIMGERLYGDRTACIRELLQNAVDTLREAREQRPSSWLPELSLKEENEGAILVVEDNGMGMDEYIIRQYFAKVGISYYDSFDFKGKFRPISEFGIGILSCFMMADYIEVDSMREGSEPIHIEIRSLTESFVPRRGTRTELGTTIKLHIKPDIIGELDLVKRVKYFAKHVEFPIKVITREDKSHIIRDEGLIPYYEDLSSIIEDKYLKEFERIWSYKQKSIMHKRRRRKGIQVGVTLLDEIVNRWWFKAIRTSDEYFGSLVSRGKLFQEGFFVGNFDEEFARLGERTWCEVNLTGETRFDLTADRSRIAGTNEELWKEISELHSEAVEELYEQFSVQSRRNWWKYHLQHYPDRMKNIPKALERSAEKGMEICTFCREGFQSRRLEEIKKWDGEIYWVGSDNHCELERFGKIMKSDSLVLVSTGYLYSYYESREEKESWWQSIVKGKNKSQDIRGEKELLRESGIKYERFNIDRKKRWFIDAGYCLEKWRFKINWINPTGEYGFETVYDINDPFSQIIVNWCKDTLPRESHLVLFEIFRSAYWWNPNVLKEKQEEAITIFKKDGVIPGDIEFEPIEYDESHFHDCPITDVA